MNPTAAPCFCFKHGPNGECLGTICKHNRGSQYCPGCYCYECPCRKKCYSSHKERKLATTIVSPRTKATSSFSTTTARLEQSSHRILAPPGGRGGNSYSSVSALHPVLGGSIFSLVFFVLCGLVFLVKRKRNQ